MVVFARQNLLSDPPFSRIDLLSCRNLLVYLESSLQKKVMPTFHYALNAKGFLVLGASESAGSFAELFEPVDRTHKIYFKKSCPTPALGLHFAPGHPATEREIPTPEQAAGRRAAGWPVETSAQREADRVAFNRFVPASVLVNSEFHVLQFRGDTGPFLKPPTGRASFNLLKMAREGLLLPLRAALNKARNENKAVRRQGVRVRQNGQTRTANLEVIPLKNIKERCYLIFFQNTDHPGRPPAREAQGEATRGSGSDRGVLSSLKTVKGHPARIGEKVGARNQDAPIAVDPAELGAWLSSRFGPPLSRPS